MFRLKHDIIRCELDPGLRVSEAKIVQRAGDRQNARALLTAQVAAPRLVKASA
jgi:hypothetical protein